MLAQKHVRGPPELVPERHSSLLSSITSEFVPAIQVLEVSAKAQC